MTTRHLIRKIAAVALFAIVVAGGFALSHGNSATPAGRGPAPAFTPPIPLGIPPELWRKMLPADNPLTAEKVALGEALYFDRRLSADGTVSCATCHDPASAFADGNPLAVGVRGQVGARNAPTILNAMFSERQFWDGRARSLEEQARHPLVSPQEMGLQSYGEAAARVASLPGYEAMFRQVFGREGVSIDTIAKAIAAYERTRLSGNAPFDRFMAGEAGALTGAQSRGWELFRGKARCAECHTFTAASPFFTDFKFHNTGVGTKGENFDRLIEEARRLRAAAVGGTPLPSLSSHAAKLSELGRYAVTKRPEDLGAFKTPGLRDVELTAPYMHDGSEKTLFDVVKFYNRGGNRNARLDKRMSPLRLTEPEMNDLVEFLRTLTSDDVIRQVQLARPQTRTPAATPDQR